MRILPTRDEITHAARALRRSPGFTTVSMLSLGIAIALAVTMFGVLDALIDPIYPFRAQEQLFTVSWQPSVRRNIPLGSVPSAEELADELVRTVPTVAQVSLFGYGGVYADQVVAPGGTADAHGSFGVALDFFDKLGVHPGAGRLFTARDSGAYADHLAVVSPELWRRLYPGKTTFAPVAVYVGDQAMTIVGVLPDRMRQAFPADIWVAPPPRSTWRPTLLVRTKAGVSRDALLRSLDPINVQLARAEGSRPNESFFRVDPVAYSQIKGNDLAVGLTLAAISVLLIACANISNLQLARGMVRVRDLAVRAALGASRAEIVRLLVTESVIIAIGGSAVAALLTLWGADAVRAVIPPSVALLGFVSPQLSWHVFVGGLLLTAFAALGCGLAPAVRVSRLNLNETLQSRAGTGTTAQTRRLYATLVVVEVAAALALVVGAGLMGGSARNLVTLDFGFTPGRIVTALVFQRFRNDTARDEAVASLLDAARALPGATVASFAELDVPAHDTLTSDDPTLPKQEFKWGDLSVLRVVNADYLRTLGIPVLSGTDFSTGDDGSTPGVILDQVAAHEFFPGVNPLGHMLKLGPRGSERPWVRVLGIAKHVRYSISRSIDDAGIPEIYLLDKQYASEVQPSRMQTLTGRLPGLFMRGNVFVRGTGGDLRPLEQRLNEVLHARAGRNGSSDLLDNTTGRLQLEESQNFLASLFVAFGLLGLGLAMIGVYGVVAHSVAQRTREFGVRIALGARTSSILALVLREGNLAIFSGIALGLIAASLGDKLLSAFVVAFDGPAEFVVYAVAPAAILLAALAATLGPALRAARVDPVEALRSE